MLKIIIVCTLCISLALISQQLKIIKKNTFRNYEFLFIIVGYFAFNAFVGERKKKLWKWVVGQ